MIEEKFNYSTNEQEFKIFTPIYVPLHKLAKYMENDKANLEIKLLKSLYPTQTLELNVKSEATHDAMFSFDNSNPKDAGRKFMFIDSDDI